MRDQRVVTGSSLCLEYPADRRFVKYARRQAIDRLGRKRHDAAAFYDRFEAVIRTVLTRSDAAKSLWTTVAGTAWQAFWAIASFIIGLGIAMFFAFANPLATAFQ